MATLRIANRWFERKTLEDGVTWLWERHVHPFLRCNIWHVRGRDRDLLVDTGLGVASVRDEIQDLCQKPLVAAATHIHYDHVGSLHEFETRLMHAAEAPRMSDYEGEFASLIAAHFGPFLDEMRKAGYRIEEETLIDALPHEGYEVATYAVTPTTPTRTVEDGDTVDLGDRHFEVMHLPGHSPGSMGLWEPASGVLFSGDAIYDGTLIDLLEDSSIPDYIQTMERLRALPVSVVHGGHEASFGRDRLLEIIDDYLATR